jgi:hypothetical protein
MLVRTCGVNKMHDNHNQRSVQKKEQQQCGWHTMPHTILHHGHHNHLWQIMVKLWIMF